MATILRASRVPTLAIILLTLGLFLFVFLHLLAEKVHAAGPTVINFQGKVTNADGTNVTDGTYPFTFRLYNTASPTTTTACASDAACLWEESHASVQVTSGIFRVELGSSCSFFSTAACNDNAAIDFNTNSLYMTMRFNNDAQGYMSPTIHFTSTPYAFNSERLSGLVAGNFVQLAQGVQTDASTTNPSIGINKTGGTADILQLQKSGADVVVISNTGTAIFKNSENSSTAFQVQNSSGTSLLTVDTANNQLSMSRSIFTGNLLPASSATVATASTATTKLVDSDNVGQHTSIAIGADGLPVISHYNATDPGLAVTKCSDSSCSSSSTVTITDADTWGQHTSIAIGTDGLPVISHYNVTDGDLAVTKCSNISCSSSSTTIVTDTDDFGQYTSIVIGADGFPVISHYNLTDTDLVVTKCTNLSCSTNSTTKITSGSNIGFETSIAIGTDTFPIIAARNVSSSNLRITKCSTTSCSSTSSDADISSAQSDGRQPSVKIGVDGMPIIAHKNFFSGDLAIVKCSTTSCSSSSETVISETDNVGQESSLAIGADGLPVISHYNVTDTDIAVTKCSTTSCSSSATTQIPDASDDVGSLSALAIGADGLPVISHYNVTDGDLAITKCGNADCSGSSSVLSGGISLGSKGIGFQSAYIGSIQTSDTVNPFTIATNDITRLSIDGSGATTLTGPLSLQPAASLVSGQTGFAQTLTNASSSGGTVNGYSQTITVSNTSSASTTNGLNLSITDGTSQVNNVTKGIVVSISGNSNSHQTGLDTTVARGFGIKTNSTGVTGGASAGCGHLNGNFSIGICSTSSALSNNSYGGFFALTGTGSISSAAALYASNDQTTGHILQLQDRITDVVVIANGGAATFKNETNSASAFIIQNATAADTLFAVDTTARSASGGNLVKIGNSTGTDGNTTILVLDNTTADPSTNLSALDGGLFYNSTDDKVRAIENGAVKTLCNTTDGCGGLDDVYNQAGTAGNTIILTAAGDGVIIQDASVTVGGNLFAVQEHSANGGANLFAVTTAGFSVQNLSEELTLSLDTSTATPHLKVHGDDAAEYADIYYDSSTNTAFFGASNGTAVLGSGTGSVSIASGTGTGFTIDGNAASSIATSAGALTITSNQAATWSTTNGALTLQAGSGTVQIASSILAGTGALTLQSAASSALTISAGSTLVLDGNSLSTIRIGDATNNITFAATSREPSLNGSARHTRYIMLAAEFPGAVMTGDGTNNTGTMTSDSETSSPYRTYYNWTSTGANDYDIWIKVPLPEDWSAWSGSGGTATGFGTAADEGVTIEFFGTNDTTICSSDIVTGAGWNSNVATCDYTGGTFATSGNFFTIRVKLAVSASGDNTRIANIKMPYLSKW